MPSSPSNKNALFTSKTPTPPNVLDSQLELPWKTLGLNYAM